MLKLKVAQMFPEVATEELDKQFWLKMDVF